MLAKAILPATLIPVWVALCSPGALVVLGALLGAFVVLAFGVLVILHRVVLGADEAPARRLCRLVKAVRDRND